MSDEYSGKAYDDQLPQTDHCFRAVLMQRILGRFTKDVKMDSTAGDFGLTTRFFCNIYQMSGRGVLTRRFRMWLTGNVNVLNIDQFSQCVVGKLMVYATDWAPNYAERKEPADIVRASGESGNGFRDLVFALI